MAIEPEPPTDPAESVHRKGPGYTRRVQVARVVETTAYLPEDLKVNTDAVQPLSPLSDGPQS